MSALITDDLLALAERTARAAGELLVERLGSVRLASTKSSPTDAVTEADHASEALIRSLLLKARPDDSILGEEDGASHGSSNVKWVVDPLDGTVNYLYGHPSGWSVSIAAEIDRTARRTVAGVVHDPMRRETFTAAAGLGARCNGEPIRVSDITDLRLGLIGTGFAYKPDVRGHQARALPRILPQVRDIRRAGSAALDLCWVACGRLDGYFESGLGPWDRAAAALIVAEAGGREELRANDLTFAAAPAIFDALVELVEVG